MLSLGMNSTKRSVNMLTVMWISQLDRDLSRYFYSSSSKLTFYQVDTQLKGKNNYDLRLQNKILAHSTVKIFCYCVKYEKKCVDINVLNIVVSQEK